MAASKKTSPKTGAKQTKLRAERRRFWLTYPPRLITTPIMWALGQKFKVIPNIRQASVTEDIGILCVELEGAPAVIKAAVAWLEKQHVKVEPVEINIIES